MASFTEQEEKVINRSVSHYRNMDANRDIAKQNVDDTLVELADFIDKNFMTFYKKMDVVLKGYAMKTVKKSKPLFKDSIKEGNDFIKDIL